MNPPRWFLRAAWAFHKGLDAISGGRLGLEAPTETKLGTLRLRTRGRRSGEPRAAFVFYVEEGAALAVVASNAGADREPGWWLNLQARSEAEVDVVGGSRPVRARVADPDARARVMARFVALDPLLRTLIRAPKPTATPVGPPTTSDTVSVAAAERQVAASRTPRALRIARKIPRDE